MKNIISTRNATYDLHTWHKILGHCNDSDIKKLPNLVKGMKIKPTTNYAFNYDIYILGKMSNDRNKILDFNATKILALEHSDLAGSIQPLAKDGYKYVINFTDDYSGLYHVIFLKTWVWHFAHYNEISSWHRPLRLCKMFTDRQRKGVHSEPFQQLLVLNRIKHKQSALYSSHQNVITEQSWQTLFSMARCLFIESKLPQNL